MAVTANSLVAPQGINASTPTTILPADTTSKKTLFTAGTNGSIVRGIAAMTNDTAANNVALYVTVGGTDYQIGTVRVAIGSGSDGAINSVDLLNTTALPFLKLDAAGNPVLLLAAGYILKAAVLVTVTAAKTLTLWAIGEDF